MILGTLNHEKIWHQHLTDLSTLPVTCRHFTLGNPKKSFFLFSCTLRIIYVISEENKLWSTCLPPPENVTTLTSEMQNFFIWLKVFCIFSNVGEPVMGCRRWLWKEPVVMCGNWNVRQAMSQHVFRVTTFCINTCFQPFLILISRIVHHALLKFSLCRNKPLP